MFLNLEQHWYRKSYTWLTLLLLPLSGLFYFIISLRQFCYRIGLKKTIHFPVPVIVIGNITTGGTGKTPLVIALAKFLKAEGFNPGIVSRGVGGMKHNVPQIVNEKSDAAVVGDEALLLAKKTECPMVVCIDRVAAVRELLDLSQCNLVIADDGLQHYRLGRAIEIAVMDGARRYGNGCLLPAGPLRELPTRLKKVDCIVTQGETGNITMQLKGDELRAIQGGAITMQLKGDELHAIQSGAKKPVDQLAHQIVHAVAAIGNPTRFFATLRSKGLNIIEHVFPDHYLFKEQDFDFSDRHSIIMTEKDAVKCETFADERFWYLPVKAIVDKRLGELLLKKLKQFQGKFSV
jgi:tetraacyldisaccharide 4'-kinase